MGMLCKIFVLLCVCLTILGCNPCRQNAEVGTVIGGIAGGLLGATIGAGTGQAVAIGVGAIGGALVGNAIGSNADAENYYCNGRGCYPHYYYRSGYNGYYYDSFEEDSF